MRFERRVFPSDFTRFLIRPKADFAEEFRRGTTTKGVWCVSGPGGYENTRDEDACFIPVVVARADLPRRADGFACAKSRLQRDPTLHLCERDIPSKRFCVGGESHVGVG